MDTSTYELSGRLYFIFRQNLIVPECTLDAGGIEVLSLEPEKLTYQWLISGQSRVGCTSVTIAHTTVVKVLFPKLGMFEYGRDERLASQFQHLC